MKLLHRLVFIMPIFLLLQCNPATNTPPSGTHSSLYATLYQQQAGEYRALCYQAFNLAGFTLDAAISTPHEKPLAIIVDIDETVLDNSPYQAQAILEGFGYPVRWAEWMNAAAAKPVPGAFDFLKRAAADGVEVFYITNRKEEFRDATLRNLNQLGFPHADNDHLLMRTMGNEKESRRELVTAKFHIVCLIGDNLGDFSGLFENQDAASRMQAVDSSLALFGNRWIVLPNVVYGSWVDALPGFRPGLSDDSLSLLLKSGLKGFR